MIIKFYYIYGKGGKVFRGFKNRDDDKQELYVDWCKPMYIQQAKLYEDERDANLLADLMHIRTLDMASNAVVLSFTIGHPRDHWGKPLKL